MRVNAAVAGVIQPLFLLISSVFSTLFILGLLVWADPIPTVTLLGIIATFYLLVYKNIRARLDHYGAISPEFSRQSFKLRATFHSIVVLAWLKIQRWKKFLISAAAPASCQ